MKNCTKIPQKASYSPLFFKSPQCNANPYNSITIYNQQFCIWALFFSPLNHAGNLLGRDPRNWETEKDKILGSTALMHYRFCPGISIAEGIPLQGHIANTQVQWQYCPMEVEEKSHSVPVLGFYFCMKLQNFSFILACIILRYCKRRGTRMERVTNEHCDASPLHSVHMLGDCMHVWKE